MKDIVISARRVRCEVLVYLLCFGLSFLLNIYAVVHFDRPWAELFTQIGYVIVISVAIYFVLWIVRLIVLGVRRLFRGGATACPASRE